MRFLAVVLLAANVIAAIGVIHARHQHRQLYVELTRLVEERDEINIDFGRLQIEQATWAEANRIDQVARTRLGMKFPEAGEVVVVQP